MDPTHATRTTYTHHTHVHTHLYSRVRRVGMALRREVLRKYREILRLSRSWEASEEAETAAERRYIREEAVSLFRKNKDVGFEYMHATPPTFPTQLIIVNGIFLIFQP